MKTQNVLAAMSTLSLLFFAAEAGAHNSGKDRMGSNSLSDEPRAENAPPMVKAPPSGQPEGNMSTYDPSGNGMVKRDRFDRYSNDELDADATPVRSRSAHPRHDWTSDSPGVSSTEEHYFAFYGEDIPALRGLQLETALNRLHHINRAEIDMAKMAETQAKSADVLNLAHQIRADHEALENKVVSLANRRNISLKGFQLATYERAVRDRLSKLGGTEFETAFLRVNERGHEEAARALRMVRNDLNDTEARNLINEALPRMMAHMLTPAQQNRARARAEEGDIGE